MGPGYPGGPKIKTLWLPRFSQGVHIRRYADESRLNRNDVAIPSMQRLDVGSFVGKGAGTPTQSRWQERWTSRFRSGREALVKWR